MTYWEAARKLRETFADDYELDDAAVDHALTEAEQDLATALLLVDDIVAKTVALWASGKLVPSSKAFRAVLSLAASFNVDIKNAAPVNDRVNSPAALLLARYADAS